MRSQLYSEGRTITPLPRKTGGGFICATFVVWNRVLLVRLKRALGLDLLIGISIACSTAGLKLLPTLIFYPLPFYDCNYFSGFIWQREQLVKD